MIPAADLLEGLDGPAAVADAAFALVCANRAFQALPPAEQAAALVPDAEDWRATPLPSGARLIQPDRRRAGLMRRADVLATLSHELRTPLNGVLGMAKLLEGTRLDATQRAYLATVRECGDHLLELVGSVLDWARLDAGKIEVEASRTDLELLLQGVTELLSPQAHAKGLDIAWAVSGPAAAVVADDGRLRQILFNLAGNAVKMTAVGGVRLSASTAPRADGRLELRLAVTDTGPGLSAEAQHRIFQPFEQTEAGVRAGGAGLGLSIVSRLAEALGGDVAVASAPGEGATFTVRVTVDPASPEQPRAEPLRGRRLAVVSESPVTAEAAKLQAEALGADVTVHADLAAAVSSADRADLVLYDVPAGRRLSTAPKGPPVLVLLSPQNRGRIPALKARGYAGYLIKPLRRASLSARALLALGLASDGDGRDDEREALPPAPTSHLRVLLAEDNPVNARLATLLLERQGCRVDHVVSGDEAVAQGLGGAHDLILLDLRMPGRDGLSAARALRRGGVAAPIAALTANAFEEDRHACREAGMDGFLTKPLEPEALRALLARCTPAKAA